MRHMVVDITARTCSCCYWQLEDFPCSHAAAALYRVNLKPINFIPSYFTKAGFEAVYAQDVNPITHDGDWNLPSQAQIINPPVQKRQAGRPKMKRFRSKDEMKKPYTVHCEKCGKCGHNKRRCPS